LTTTREYSSADSGALALTGEAGTLNDILYQCLVTGTGLSQPALGWTRLHTTTDKAVYQAPEGIAFPFQIDDTGPGAGAFEARFYGAESFSAIDTPTRPFPTVAQFANGLFWRKSATLDNTPRPWKLIGDERTFYFGAYTGDLANTYFAVGFGEFFSFVATDPYRSFIMGRGIENTSGSNSSIDGFDVNTVSTSLHVGNYLARDTAGNVGAISAGKHGDVAQAASGALAGNMATPNPANNKYYTKSMTIHQTSGGNHDRGRLRGLRHWLHPATAVSDGYALDGAGDLAGRTMRVWKGLPGGGVAIFFTDTWESN
jgi:hypothetical protein